MALNKIRVLIVDDIAETRENIRKLLQFESDVDVTGTARSGKEGIQLAQELDPDVVLMDINMPDIDGITATEVIRQKSPHIQVLILSVQSDGNYMRKAMLAGAPRGADRGGKRERGVRSRGAVSRLRRFGDPVQRHAAGGQPGAPRRHRARVHQAADGAVPGRGDRDSVSHADGRDEAATRLKAEG